jgi:flagella basal body P-ring formation protein FlgA
MRLIFAFAALFGFVEAWGCELAIPARVLVTSSSNGAWPFENKNCTSQQFDAVHEVLRDQDGAIPLARLQAAIGGEIHLRSEESTIRVENTAYLIRKSFTDVGNAGMVIGNPFQGNLIAIPKDSEFVLHCHPCQFNGDEVMRLHVRSFQGGETDYTFQAKFSRYVNAYRTRRNISAFSADLKPEMFEKVSVPDAAYGQYLTDLSKLAFYKTNKTLRIGEIVRVSDLVPQTLVKAGDRVELIFENSHVRVKSQALSRQNGGMGDDIEVWNQTNGKKYHGTVIDHNRVQVNL